MLHGRPDCRAAAADEAENLEEQLAVAARRFHDGEKLSDIVGSPMCELIKSAGALRSVLARRGRADGTLARDPQSILFKAEARQLVAEYSAAGFNSGGADLPSRRFLSNRMREIIGSRGSEVELTLSEAKVIVSEYIISVSHGQKYGARAARIKVCIT